MELTKHERTALWERLTIWAGPEGHEFARWCGKHARLLAGERLLKRHQAIILPEYDRTRLLRSLRGMVAEFGADRPGLASWARRRILELDPAEHDSLLDALNEANRENTLDDFDQRAKGALVTQWNDEDELRGWTMDTLDGPMRLDSEGRWVPA